MHCQTNYHFGSVFHCEMQYKVSLNFVHQGAGVADARILLDGKQQVVTKSDGSYHLDSMKAGTYNLQVISDRVFFDKTTVKVTPNTPQLPDVIATR